MEDRGTESRKGDIYSCAWLGVVLPGLVEDAASYSFCFCFFGTVVKQSQSYSGTEVGNRKVENKEEVSEAVTVFSR